MHHAVTTVKRDGRVVDETTTPFGVREALFDAKRGFLLNGKPVKLNGVCLHHEAGVIDTCGFPKDGYYFYQSQWTEAPMLHVFPHWTWAGREGQVVPVVAFTNCDSVELFLNGRSLGRKGYSFPHSGFVGNWGDYPSRSRGLRTTADLHLQWDVPYEPGTLKAVGTRDGKAVSTVEVSTVGAPAALALTADRPQIRADRRDVAHFVLAVVDAQGRTVPDANPEVRFALTGPGTLIGVDNGDMTSHEAYKADRRKAFHGLALAMVQATDRPGEIVLTAESPGLRGAVARTRSA